MLLKLIINVLYLLIIFLCTIVTYGVLLIGFMVLVMLIHDIPVNSGSLIIVLKVAVTIAIIHMLILYLLEGTVSYMIKEVNNTLKSINILLDDEQLKNNKKTKEDNTDDSVVKCSVIHKDDTVLQVTQVPVESLKLPNFDDEVNKKEG